MKMESQETVWSICCRLFSLCIYRHGAKYVLGLSHTKLGFVDVRASCEL